MASEITQYLDESGEPIKAEGISLPKGYALLSSKKKDTPKKNVKELKVQAEGMKPAPIDYTSNPKNEGLYEMYGRTGAGDATGSISVPYSKVKSYLSSGGTFAGDTGSGARYDKDKAAEGKPVSWYQNIIQSPALVSTPNEKQQAGSFSNLDKAAARTVLATPAYVKQLWDAAQSMHRGEVSGGDEFANLINPAQLPKQLYDQYQVDAKIDKKMAADNLLGSLAGLGVVGAVTHGAAKAIASIPKRGLTEHPINIISEHPVTGELNHSPQEVAAPSAAPDKPNAEPINAYHGTPAQFEGPPRTDGLGAHFTLDPELAKKFAEGRPYHASKGRVIEAQLGINNPLRIEDHTGSHTEAAGTIQALVEQGHLPAEEFDSNTVADRQTTRHQELLEKAGVIDHEAPLGTPPTEEWKKANYDAWIKVNNEELEKAKNWLKSKGYDGLVYDNKAEGHGDSYVAFDPHQISISNSGMDTAASVPIAPYKYEPIDTSKEVTGQFYHGTKAPISSASELDPGSHGNEQALYGIGTYLTDNPEVAKGYANTKGKGPEGKVLPATIDSAKLLNLEQPLPAAAHSIFENMLQGITGEKESLPTTMSGKQLFGRLQEAMQDEGWPRSEAQDTLGELTSELRQQGYHGLWHEGGGKVGIGPHNVAIIFPDYGVGRPLTEIVRDTVPEVNPEVKTDSEPDFEKMSDEEFKEYARAKKEEREKREAAGETWNDQIWNDSKSPVMQHEDNGIVYQSKDTGIHGIAVRAFKDGKKIAEVDIGSEDDPKEAFISGVFVPEGMRGKGIARKLYEQLPSIAKSHGIDRIVGEGVQTEGGIGIWKSLEKSGLAKPLEAFNQTRLGMATADSADVHKSGAEGIRSITEKETPDTKGQEPDDRRVDLEARKRVEDMTPEEMKKALLTSDVTGAPNRRAFDDAEHVSPSPAIGMSDADGLKALNDKFGYAAGNELLKAKADALKAAGLDAYHEKGDEFLYRGESPESLKEKLDKAREILRDRTIEVTLKDGKKLHFKGADFSYGTGKDLDESESGLKQHKESREASGERKRGELRGITEVRPEDGDEHNSSSELEDATPSAEQEDPSTDLDVNSVSEVDAEIVPEQPKGEDVSPPAVSSSIPVQGGTQLSSAPIQIPVVPVVRMQALPMAQVRAMAAARNPQRQPKSAREVMEEAKSRMGNSIVP